MIKFYITLIIFLFSSSSYSQFSYNGWVEQWPYPTIRDLKAVEFINPNTGWVFGITGTIIKTTNAGTNWLIQNPIDSAGYTQVIALSDNKVIVCGPKGHITYTTNGGSSWHFANSSTVRNIRSMFFLDPNTGYACGDGGTFIKSTNGGLSWDSIPTFFSNQLNDIQFIDSMRGFAVSENNFLLKTTDGGNFWTSNNPTTCRYAVHFLNQQTGFVTGNGGGIKRTTDGGVSWTTYYSGLGDFHKIIFFNSTTGIFYKFNGTTIIKTTDGGETFSFYSSEINLQNVDFYSESSAYNVGSYGFISKSNNGGLNWSTLTKGTREYLASVYFFDLNNGLICGNNGIIIRTTNGGTEWQDVISGTTEGLKEIYFINNSTGFITGDNGTMLKTTNGGLNWQTLNTGVASSIISRVAFENANTGIAAVKEEYQLIKTTNGGLNWTTITIPFSSASVAHITGSRYIASGLDFGMFGWDKIFMSTNSGNNWSAPLYTDLVPQPLTEFEFVDIMTGYAIKPRGNTVTQLFKTTNSGYNWNVIVNYIPRELNEFNRGNDFERIAISFPDATTGYFFEDIVGDDRIRKTTNGSNFNSYDPNPQDISYYGMYFINPTTGYICGANGSILKTTTGGLVVTNALTQSGNEIPDKIFLKQNYPNPFNPSTRIGFDLSNQNFVRLKIYNTLGQEVALLVNEKLNAGSYEYTFDGSVLPSGIYFYKLETGEFFETKKMVLVK